MMSDLIHIALAQIPFRVGDIQANIDTIINSAIYARDQLQADLIVFPELIICGYPAEDLLFRRDFIQQANRAIDLVAETVTDIGLVIGYPEFDGTHLYNSAAVLYQGAMLANYRKRILPNYGVFDEQRYFTAGNDLCLFEFHGTYFGLTICEDVWQHGIILQNRQAGAEILLSLNASPFQSGKMLQREQLIREQSSQAAIPIVYVNQIGGQDELVFDGASFVTNKQGEIIFRAAEFQSQIQVIPFLSTQPIPQNCAPIYQSIASDYQALVLGIR
ncbi:MAG: hypothetical protein RL637_293, partial [Pseudomonadota bacterium]